MVVNDGDHTDQDGKGYQAAIDESEKAAANSGQKHSTAPRSLNSW